MSIPDTLTAGDTWEWTDSVADYPATDGWTLKYALLKDGVRIVVTADADGADYSVSVTAATTAGYTPGIYTVTHYVTKGSGPTLERHTIASSVVEIEPDLSAQSTGYDARTDARKILDSLMTAYQAAVASRAFVSEYEIAGRRMKFNNKADWITEIQFWKSEVAREERSRNIGPGGGRVLVRF